MLILVVVLGLVFVPRPRFHLRRVRALVFWVPFSFHLDFLVTGLLSGALLAHPFLLVVSLAMTGLAFWLHWPALTRNRSRLTPHVGT